MNASLLNEHYESNVAANKLKRRSKLEVSMNAER
jgi:hypothetical protein